MATSADAALVGRLKIASSGCTDGVGVFCVSGSSKIMALDAPGWLEDAVRLASESVDDAALLVSSSRSAAPSDGFNVAGMKVLPAFTLVCDGRSFLDG